MPNLVRTEWRGEIRLQLDKEEGPVPALSLQISIDSYNKISGTMQWIPWFEEQEPPPMREVPLTGAYDSKNGRFSVVIDKSFSKESQTIQVMSIPLVGGGTRQERIQVIERKLDIIKGRLDGSVSSPQTAGGTMEIVHTTSIVVDGKTEGSGSNPVRGTWKLDQRK